MTGRPYLLGVTGSVGMGKSTTARMFGAAGYPVWDADAAVHRLYERGGRGVAAIAALAPDAVRDGHVDRARLATLIEADPGLLGRVEAEIHPLVALDRQEFIDECHAAELIIFDIPLLFETGADAWLDGVLVVTASPELQRERVMARPGMTERKLSTILGRQMPDAEKRRRADFVIDTGDGLAAARAAVQGVIGQIRKAGDDA